MRLTLADLSSVPALDWTEFDPDFGESDDFYGLESAGGGRILRRLYRGPDVPIRLIVTSDGVEWSELPLPNGFHLADISSDADATIDVAGDRWVAFGQDVTEDPHENVGRDVWFSDDQGLWWIEATIEVPQRADPLPPYATEESAVLEALASGDRLVVVVRTSTRLYLESLLADRDLLLPGKDLVNWKPSRDRVTLIFVDELPPDGRSVQRGRDRHRLAELEMSYEKLGLSTQQRELLRRREHAVTRIYTGGGPSLDLRAEFEGWVYQVTGVASTEGIVLAAQGNWEALLTSTDGRAWTDEPLGTVELWATGGDGTLWAASRTPKGTRIDRIRARDGRATVAFLEGVENFCSFSAGPAGVVAAALTGTSASEPALMKSMRQGRTYRGDGNYRSDEVWLVWSPDGVSWTWQSASEAFEVDPRRRISVTLAVGRDFVLAEVTDMGFLPEFPVGRAVGFARPSAAGDRTAALPRPHWFMARVS